MKAKLILIAAVAVLLGTLALAPPAQAGHLDWSFGVGFHAGGLQFRVGFAPLGHGGHSGPFFLTTSRLHYPGYGCNGACFRRGAGYYHHASCPLLSFHLGHGGYGPDYYVQSYSPYRGYRQGYGRYPIRSYGYYYRDGYRDRYRSYGHHYRDRQYRDRHYRDRHYRDQRYRGHRGPRGHGHDRRRGRDWDDDSDSDSDSDRRGRQYRDNRGDRGHDGSRGPAQPRRGARHTRPPR